MPTDVVKMVKGEAQSYSSCPLYQVENVKSKLTDLQLAACDPSIDGCCVNGDAPLFQQPYAELLDTSVTSFNRVLTVANSSTSCSLCSLKFQNLSEQKEHFRSDWHLYNLKQKLRGMSPVTEEMFANISENLSSSISGSESESENEDINCASFEDMSTDIGPTGKPFSSTADTASNSHCNHSVNKRNYPKLFLKNSNGELISVYKCILYHKKHPPSSIKLCLEYLSKLPGAMSWAVFLVNSGHFAATIFENGKVMKHKTFHRYTVRAKQGKSQGSRDGRGNAPRSAGASLRRHNESALVQDVQELLTSWSDTLKKCDLIFLRAPSFNQQMLFSGKNPPLSRSDMRIRSIPFHTRRPTHNETCRVHEMLASVECYGNESEMQEFIPRSPPRHFSSDTGQLEIITDSFLFRSNSGKSLSFDKKKRNSKSKLGKKPGEGEAAKENGACSNPSNDADDKNAEEDVKPLGSPSDVEIDDCQFHFFSQEILTSFLDPDQIDFGFQTPVKFNKNNSDSKPKPATKGSKEKDHIRNELYRACKTGNVANLKKLISWLTVNAAVSDSPSKEKGGKKKKTSNSEEAVQTSVDPKNISESTKSKSVPHMVTPSTSSCVSETTSVSGDMQNSEAAVAAATATVAAATVAAAGDDAMTSNGEFDRTVDEECLNLVMADDIKFPDILNEHWGRDKHTLLHAVAQNCRPEIISPLLEAGANPAISNGKGILPYCIADKETRNEFRRFMAKFPDKYGYRKAQIPSPLTPALEAEKKQKESIKKKVKQQRLKEKRSAKVKKAAAIQQQQLEQQQQQLEQLRFKNLSEREKRALAAERRILNTKDSEEEKPVFSRCSQCQCNISGLIPFEYYDFRFCTPKCLKDHRLKSSKSS
ncbi:ankyrin repeat and zinc finger domain-containing protein 1-like [Argonauta hians]